MKNGGGKCAAFFVKLINIALYCRNGSKIEKRVIGVGEEQPQLPAGQMNSAYAHLVNHRRI